MSAIRQLPPPPRRPRTDRRASWRARLPALQWHLDKLRQIEEAVEQVLAQPKFNAAGLAALITRAEHARGAVDALMAEHPDELDGMTPEQLAESAGRAMEGWPDQVLEVAFRVYALRHHGRMVFVSDSGHRAEFDPGQDGWTSG